MTFKRWWAHTFLPNFIAYAGKFFLKILSLTYKIQIEGMEQFRKSAKDGNAILLLWHDQLLMTAPIFQQATPEITYAAFISQSKDGEALAIFTNSFKNGRTIRVKHHAKHAALLEMIERLKEKSQVLIVTPDGPRGPRRKLKPGVALAAKETNANIFIFKWTADKCWHLKSWDKMAIPKPFSTIHATISLPVQLSLNSSQESDVIFLQNQLD